MPVLIGMIHMMWHVAQSPFFSLWAFVAMSYVQTWAYLRQLSSEARYLEVVKSGKWIWMYDNLDIHKAVRMSDN